MILNGDQSATDTQERHGRRHTSYATRDGDWRKHAISAQLDSVGNLQSRAFKANFHPKPNHLTCAELYSVLCINLIALPQECRKDVSTTAHTNLTSKLNISPTTFPSTSPLIPHSPSIFANRWSFCGNWMLSLGEKSSGSPPFTPSRGNWVKLRVRLMSGIVGKVEHEWGFPQGDKWIAMVKHYPVGHCWHICTFVLEEANSSC